MKALYLLLVAACLLTTVPLELVLGVRVYRRPVRLLLTLGCVAVPFLGWDVWAIAAHHWRYSKRFTSGLVLPGHLPVEEVLFFLVVPTCAIATLEAVRVVRHWPVGDEP
jgi:lycopene cyclase domain-containing protein